MSDLLQAVNDYLALRRALGYKLDVGHMPGRHRAVDANQVTGEAAMTIYADPMTDSRRVVREFEDIAEQREAAAARRARDGALSMSERLERVHQLCAQLARLQPVRPKQR